jgi:hypothetical protein
VDLFMAISQGVGVSLATGVRPFLPPLVVGVLAREDAGVDFNATGYGFLESIPWLLLLVVLIALATLAARSRTAVPAMLLAGVAVVIGSLEFAGSLAEEGYTPVPGYPAGAVCAVIGFAAAAAFFGRAASRARTGGEDEAASLVDLFAQGAAVVLAVLAVLVSPISWIAVGFALWVLLVQRRRRAEKYEGLRVLR